MSQVTAHIAAPLIVLLATIDSTSDQLGGEWVEGVCAKRDLLAPNTVDALAQCAQEAGEHFSANQIESTVKALKERSDKLAEALEWIESQSDAEPLNSERRMIAATLAAIYAEYAPGYFDAC